MSLPRPAKYLAHSCSAMLMLMLFLLAGLHALDFREGGRAVNTSLTPHTRRSGSPDFTLPAFRTSGNKDITFHHSYLYEVHTAPYGHHPSMIHNFSMDLKLHDFFSLSASKVSRAVRVWFPCGDLPSGTHRFLCNPGGVRHGWQQ